MRTGTSQELIIYLVNQPKDKKFDLKEHRDKRTLSQNALYWQVLTKVADALRMSKVEAHNRMLRDYGRDFEIAGQRIGRYFPDTEEVEQAMLRSETVHFRPTAHTKVTEDGVMRAWYMLKGSHDMTTEEMTILVDGLFEEAKQLEIEVMSERDLEALRQYEASKNKGNSDSSRSEASGVGA